MKRQFFIFFLISFGLLSCKHNPKAKNENAQKSKQKDIAIKLADYIKLNPEAAKEVKNWKDYQDFVSLFDNYKNITPSAALSNAKELNTMAAQLKDSLKMANLKVVPFRARLNVLHNETLRLQDMADIPNLPDEVVKQQLEQILEAFNATNAKLNNMMNLKALEQKLDTEGILHKK
jgi:hypothetical protein